MIKVIMLSPKDYAGSGFEIVKAIRKYSKIIDIHLIVEDRTRFNHPTDLFLRDLGRRCAQEMVLKADILHFKGDFLPRRRFMALVIPQSKPKVITVGGSGFRRVQGTKDRWCKSWYSLQKYIQFSDVRTAITPDLNYKGFDAVWTPHCIDIEKNIKCWKDRERPLIVHSPSEKMKKGTELILAGIDRLQKRYDFDFRLIEGMSNSECIKLKREATLLIDQIIVGWYGMNAVETMAAGVPVAAYISAQAVQQGGIKNLPVINTGNDIETFCKAIEGFLLMSHTKKAELSRQTRHWIVTTHSYFRNYRVWEEIYSNLLK